MNEALNNTQKLTTICNSQIFAQVEQMSGAEFNLDGPNTAAVIERET